MYHYYPKTSNQIVVLQSSFIATTPVTEKQLYIAFQNQLRRHLVVKGIAAYGETLTDFVLPRAYLQSLSILNYQNELLLTLSPAIVRHEEPFAAVVTNAITFNTLPPLFVVPPQNSIVQSILYQFNRQILGGFLTIPKGYGHLVILCHCIRNFTNSCVSILTHNIKRKEKWLNLVPDAFVISEQETENTESLVKKIQETTSCNFVIFDDIAKMKTIHELFIAHNCFHNTCRMIAFSYDSIHDAVLSYFIGPTILYHETNNSHWIPSMSSSNDGCHANMNIISNMLKIRKSRLTSNEIETIRTSLHMVPLDIMKKKNSNRNSTTNTTAFDAFMECDEFLHVPRFFEQNVYSMDDSDSLMNQVMLDVSKGLELTNADFSGTLKLYQQQAADIVLHRMRNSYSSGSIVCLPCGKGKTVLGTYIASVFGRKTIVLVHNTDLLDQWKKRIAVFLPNARIGIIQQNTFEVEGYDISIGLLQSIALRTDYPEHEMRSFGLCIVDECHRIGCKFFSTAVAKMFAAHIVGLSATPRRKDGLERLMHYSLGPIIYELKREFIQVKVDVIQYVPQNVRVRELPYGRPRMLSELAEEKARNQMVLTILMHLVHAKERCVIVLSERTQQLEEFAIDLTRAPYFIANEQIGLSIGRIKRPRRQEIYANAQYRIILTTYQLAREALDVPRLDTLLMATPTSDLVQAIGRILREYPNKKTPLVIDIADVLDGFLSSANTRKRYYKKESYEIHKYNDIGQYMAALQQASG